MLFVATGEIQTGKTRWLSRLVEELEAEGVVCFGVLSPGIWRTDNNSSEGFEKLGIETVLLPSRERFPFAHRRDIAEAGGKLGTCRQSEQEGLSWAIADDAFEAVNKHFHNYAVREKNGDQKEHFVLIDELGRLELMRGRGFTEALKLLEAGPSQSHEHALIVVRKGLLELAAELFEQTWDEVQIINCDNDAKEHIKAVLGSKEKA